MGGLGFGGCCDLGQFLLTQHGLQTGNLAAVESDLGGIVDGRYRVRYFQFTISLLGDEDTFAEFFNA